MTGAEDREAEAARAEQILRDEPRSILSFVFNAILIRIGWIFKTESVIIPVFLDSISGAGWVRGLLPVLSRIGQSVPPFLFADRISRLPHKRGLLIATTLGMGLPFLVLASGLAVSGPWRRPIHVVAFLGLYTIFFAAAGLALLPLGALQGKLVRAERRGRLLALSTFGGTVPAAIAAWWWLPGWLAMGPAGFVRIFVFTGALFCISVLPLLWMREPADLPRRETAGRGGGAIRGALQVLRGDPNYRRLVVVSALFTTSIILLPHYQSLARERLDLGSGQLMLWVVVQNLAFGASSAILGPLADRVGNRLMIRWVILLSAAVPSFALWVTTLEPELGRRLFVGVFLGIGLMPIAFRLTTNYILEISGERDHPRYLSISQLCTAAVILSSPLFGLAVDRVGYEAVFGGVTSLVLAGWLLTFWLVEPRDRGGASASPRPAR